MPGIECRNREFLTTTLAIPSKMALATLVEPGRLSLALSVLITEPIRAQKFQLRQLLFYAMASPKERGEGDLDPEF
jgi:hypothetical protein